MTSTLFREPFLVLVLIAGIAVPGVAQQTIGGILIGEGSHRPIGNAHLSLVDDSDRVIARTVSDSSLGQFYLDAPRPGHYAVSIRVGRGGLFRSPDFQLDSGQVIQRTFAVPEFPRAVLEAYLPDDVTTRASMLPDLRLLRYPDDLRSRGVQAIVRTTFVVDRQGRADMETFRVLESSDPEFALAVRHMVSRARYTPAERDGTVVSQVYDQAVELQRPPSTPIGPLSHRDSGFWVSGLITLRDDRARGVPVSDRTVQVLPSSRSPRQRCRTTSRTPVSCH